jgi:hypothetical protein
MQPTGFERELELNRRAYAALRDQIRRDYAGQYVAMAFGKVVAVSADFHEAQACVGKLMPAPEHVVIFAADEEPAWEPYESSYKVFLPES